MTENELRDWFAGQAMAGSCEYVIRSEMSKSEWANICYDIADAMMVERNKRLGKPGSSYRL